MDVIIECIKRILEIYEYDIKSNITNKIKI